MGLKDIPWLVIVQWPGSSPGVYGPFKTRKEAEAWEADHIPRGPMIWFQRLIPNI